MLIEGESGTGKELAAQSIHQLSGRKKFIAVHCAALSPQLLESELFGHERGAFTGAMEKRIGRFEQANGGTLFLDEIGEIDAHTQVKLLRVLGEERSFERVGGNQQIRVDVRLVTATNKNLEKLVSEGKFREDLFYRLNVVKITMPPLRGRREDIPLLAKTFLARFAKENGKPVRELTSDAMNCIQSYGWPGNVRELRTVIEHGVVMSNGPKITIRDLPLSLREEGPLRNEGDAAAGRCGQFARERAPAHPARARGVQRQQEQGGDQARHQPPHVAPEAERDARGRKTMLPEAMETSRLHRPHGAAG